MQTVSIGDNLHEISKPVFLGVFFWKKNKKNIPLCQLLKILPRVLSVEGQEGVGVWLQCTLTTIPLTPCLYEAAFSTWYSNVHGASISILYVMIHEATFSTWCAWG